MNVPGRRPVVIDLASLDLSNPQVTLLADHDATLKGTAVPNSHERRSANHMANIQIGVEYGCYSVVLSAKCKPRLFKVVTFDLSRTKDFPSGRG